MRILIQDLQREPIEFTREFAPGDIQYGAEVTQTAPLTIEGRADLVEEHHGPGQTVEDIRVRGKYSSEFELQCARCLTAVPESLTGEFDLLYRPSAVESGADEHSITTSETEIGYYQGDGLELEDVLREQVLLSLPARVLCSPDCKGLCPHCGQDLNSASCSCTQSSPDPRWSALSELRTRIKP